MRTAIRYCPPRLATLILLAKLGTPALFIATFATFATLAGLALAPNAFAATTFTTLNVPKRITLADTNNTCLTLPKGTDYLRIRPIASVVYMEISGTDGGAKGTAYETYSADADSYRAVHMYGRTGEVCISGSAAAVVEITPLTYGK